MVFVAGLGNSSPEPQMSLDPPPLLSDVIAEPTGRRTFLSRASKLGLSVPAAAALAGCRPSEEQRQAADTGRASRSPGMLQNPNSRLDTAHDVRGHTTSTAEGAAS